MEKKIKIYKFKKVKHSVIMKLLEIDKYGNYIMENYDYKGLRYYVSPDEVEEVKR